MATHWDHSFQANVEALLLVELQLLQGHPRLPDEFIVPKLVFVAHREAGGTKGGASEDWRSPGGVKGHRCFLPESFARHLLVGDPVVDEGLVPHGIQGGLQCLGAKLVGLRAEETRRSGGDVTDVRSVHYSTAHLTGSRQQVQLNVRVGESIRVHRLQTLRKKRRKFKLQK